MTVNTTTLPLARVSDHVSMTLTNVDEMVEKDRGRSEETQDPISMSNIDEQSLEQGMAEKPMP